MVITLPAELETALEEAARSKGTSAEALAIGALRERFLRRDISLEPRDDWERRLLAIGTDCGVSLSDSAVSSEGLYE